MEEYWIGKGINIDKVWNDFDQGKGYIKKFQSIEVYKLEVKFDCYKPSDPIFNFEALFKSFKHSFHDFKKEFFSVDEYNRFAPLYFYEVKRGTEMWGWLAESTPVVFYAISLWLFYKKLEKVHLDNELKKIDIKNKKADLAIKISQNPKILDFVERSSFLSHNKATQKLIEQKPVSIKIIDPKTGQPFLELGE